MVARLLILSSQVLENCVKQVYDEILDVLLRQVHMSRKENENAAETRIITKQPCGSRGVNLWELVTAPLSVKIVFEKFIPLKRATKRPPSHFVALLSRENN